ncbi:MAG: phosphotransferase [Acidimicrobiales bacterium]
MLLRHLQAHGFPAPRPLGRDEQGRQVLGWIEGETTWDDHGRFWGELDRLHAVARLARRLHDILDEFRPPRDAEWRGGWGGITPGGPICHRDLAPYNFVVTTLGDFAVIDWDGARPGDRLLELAFFIESFALLRRDETCARVGYTRPPDRVARVEVMWQGYGAGDGLRAPLAEALVTNARDRAAFGRAMFEQRREPWASWWAKDHGAGDEEDLALTEAVAAAWTT